MKLCFEFHFLTKYWCQFHIMSLFPNPFSKLSREDRLTFELINSPGLNIARTSILQKLPLYPNINIMTAFWAAGPLFPVLETALPF